MPSLDDIRKSIEFNNEHADIRNIDKYGPITNDTILIIVQVVVCGVCCNQCVQVHDRTKYLEMLVQSLAVTRHIDRTLLIFSHDYFSPDINAVIRNINFARVSSTCVQRVSTPCR